MKKRTVKRIALTVLSVFVFLVAILAVHIYVVMRPRADASTRIMARMDIRQPIDRQDADKITAWLYRQKGVDHVMVNPQTEIAIFTFAPVKTDADRIVRDFNASLPYKAKRFLPTQQQMMSGCPVATNSFAFAAYHFMKRIF